MHVALPRVCLFGSLLLTSLSLTGCRQNAVSPAVAPVSARTVAVSSAVTQVQSTPFYQQAHQACFRHDYRQAADLLESLAATPGLTPEAVAFVQRQRSLCLQDAGLPAASLPKTMMLPAQSPQDADCGPKALLIVCQKLGVQVDLPRLRQTAGTTSQGTTLAGLQQAVVKLGLKAEGVQVSREALPDTAVPAIAWTNRNHYIALLALKGSGDKATATIHDPNQTKEQTLSQEQFLQRSGGYLLLIHR